MSFLLLRLPDRLCNNLVWLEFLPCSKHWCIRLDRAVRLYSYKSSCRTKTLLLELDNLHMLRVNLRNYHRYVRCPAVRAVVRDNRCLCLCVCILDSFDLVLRHINSTEYKINGRSNLFYFVYIVYDQLLNRFRHRCIHLPTVTNCLFVSLACTTWAGCHCHNLKPWMVLKK